MHYIEEIFNYITEEAHKFFQKETVVIKYMCTDEFQSCFIGFFICYTELKAAPHSFVCWPLSSPSGAVQG